MCYLDPVASRGGHATMYNISFVNPCDHFISAKVTHSLIYTRVKDVSHVLRMRRPKLRSNNRTI